MLQQSLAEECRGGSSQAKDVRRFRCELQGVSHFVEVLVGRPVDIPKRPSTSGYNRPGGPPIKSIASTFLATISLFAVALNAFSDQVAVNWSGNPVIVSASGGSPYGALDPTINSEQNGAEADLFVVYDGFSDGGYSNPYSQSPTSSMGSTIDIPFTVTSPTDVTLALTVGMEDGGTSCGDSNCNPDLAAWTFAGGFSGTLSVLNTGLSIPFGDASTAAAVCDVGIECTGTLDLSDTQSGSVQLAAGTYTLEATFLAWNDSIGDSGSDGGLSAVISDTAPEPGANLADDRRFRTRDRTLSVASAFAFQQP